MINITDIQCPKCGAKYFKELGSSSLGSAFDSVLGFAFNDCVLRPTPQRIYKDGKLQNPEDFVPAPTKVHYECLECKCHFYVKTVYALDGGEKYEIIDEDAERENWKQEIAAKQAERKAKKKVETVNEPHIEPGTAVATLQATEPTNTCIYDYRDADTLRTEIEKLAQRLTNLEEEWIAAKKAECET